MGRKTQVVLAVIGALALLAGVAAYVIETDEEAIERITEECRDAFLAGDVSRILDRLEPGATGEAAMIGRGALADLVRRAVMEHSAKVRAVEFGRREIEIDGDEATGRWLAWVRLRRSARPEHGGAGVMKLAARIEYRRSDAGWRIRRIEVGAP